MKTRLESALDNQGSLQDILTCAITTGYTSTFLQVIARTSSPSSSPTSQQLYPPFHLCIVDPPHPTRFPFFLWWTIALSWADGQKIEAKSYAHIHAHTDCIMKYSRTLPHGLYGHYDTTIHPSRPIVGDSKGICSRVLALEMKSCRFAQCLGV